MVAVSVKSPRSPVNLEQELGCRGSCRRDDVDDQLVRHVLGDRFAGGFERDAVALADREGGQLAEFAEAVAQRINLVTAGDREQVGAVCAICLMDGGSLTATSGSAWASSGRLAPEINPTKTRQTYLKFPDQTAWVSLSVG